MITRSHTGRSAAIYPLTDVQQTVLSSAPPTPRPSAPPTFRSKRANPQRPNPDVPPAVPEARSATQRHAAAIQRIFQDQAYGEGIAFSLTSVDRTLLVEFEKVVLNPLLQAGLFTSDIRRNAIGYACVQRWLSNYGADTSQYGPSLSNAVSALIQIVHHIDTHYQPTSVDSRMHKLIEDLALAPEALIQFAENLQRINNNPVSLDEKVLDLFRKHVSNSTMLCRMLLVLAKDHASPYILTQTHREALAVALARHPNPTEAQQLEIKAWIEEDDENRKTIRYLALMGNPSEAGVEPLPLRLQEPMDAPAPYRQIWQLLEQIPRHKVSLDTVIEQLSNLVPEAHRVATTNAYRRMQALDLMRNRNHWILPLLRPDMAVELAQSRLLERVYFERVGFEPGSALLEYVGIVRSGHWLKAYRFLSPAGPVPFDHQIERLHALAVRNGVLPAVDSIDEKLPLLILEGIKQQLADLEGFPQDEHGFLSDQPQIAALSRGRTLEHLRRIQRHLGVRGATGRAQLNAVAHALQSQFPTVGAPPAAHIAALTSMTVLIDALRILTKNFANPLDAATINALRLAGKHAPLLAQVLDEMSTERIAAYTQPGAIQRFMALMALMPLDRALSSEEESALVAVYKRSDGLSAVRTAEIATWWNETVPNKKRLRWLSLMIFPTDAPDLKFPLNVNAAVQLTHPYDRFLWILNSVDKVRPPPKPQTPAEIAAQVTPLKQPPPLKYIVEDADGLREDFTHALSQLAPLEDQVAVRAVYKKMISLGLIDFKNLEHLVLPLLRPELAPEILQSSLLEFIANLHDGNSLGGYFDEFDGFDFLDYLKIISGTGTESYQKLYLLLEPKPQVDATPLTQRAAVQGIGKSHLRRGTVAVAHIRADVETMLNSWHAPQGGEFRGSPLLHPTVALLHRWMKPLAQATEPRVRWVGHAVLQTLQWITTGANTRSDVMTTLHWVERICTVFSQLPDLASGRWDTQTVLAVAQAGVHAPAFVRLINALPAQLYMAIVQQEGAMSNVLGTFIRHILPAVTAARPGASSIISGLDGFIRALERCVKPQTAAKRLKAWSKLMVWGPPSSVAWSSVPRLILPEVQRLLQWVTRAARQQLNPLPISAHARDRLSLLWLMLPQISEQLSALVAKSAATGRLESTIWALEALVPGAFDNPADQIRLAALLDVSPTILAEQLRPSAAAAPALVPRAPLVNPPTVRQAAPLLAAVRSTPPASPTRGAVEIVRPTAVQLQPLVVPSGLPKRGATSVESYRKRPR